MNISEILNYGKFIAYFKINKTNKLKQAKLPSTFQLVQHTHTMKTIQSHTQNTNTYRIITETTATTTTQTAETTAAEYLQ